MTHRGLRKHTDNWRKHTKTERTHTEMQRKDTKTGGKDQAQRQRRTFKERESYRTQTSDTAQAQRMDHNAQTPRKHREWTRALDDAATTLERKRNQKFECPGVTLAANYRGPGRPGARADVARRNPHKTPPLDPLFGLPPPAHQRILESSGENLATFLHFISNLDDTWEIPRRYLVVTWVLSP